MSDAAKKSVVSWLDFTLMAVGFWMLFSPAFLKFNSDKPDNWIAVLMGLVVITLAFTLRRAFRAWGVWITLAAGAFLVVLPWVAGLHAGPKVTMNSVICGLIVIAAALGRLYAHNHGLDKVPEAPPA